MNSVLVNYTLIAIAWAVVGRGLPPPLPLVCSVAGLVFLLIGLARHFGGI